jgi:hypothetical protein
MLTAGDETEMTPLVYGTASQYDVMWSTPGSYCLQKKQYWQAMQAEISLLALAQASGLAAS